MKIKFQSLVTAVILFAIITLAACKKEASSNAPEVSDQEAQTISTENSIAEAEDDDITEIGLSLGADLEVAAETNGGQLPVLKTTDARVRLKLEFFANLYYKVGPCTEISVEPNDGSFPKTITIDYGEGCICRDGKFRKGAMLFTFSKPIRQTGAELVITLDSFYVNRAHIEGVKTITNLSENGQLKYSVQVEDRKITFPNGRGFTINRLKVITQIAGMDTRIIRDDVFSMEGRSKIEYNNGITVVKNTETPLIKPVACPYIVAGKLKVKINRREFWVDFGDGACDNKAVLSWKGGEIVIML